MPTYEYECLNCGEHFDVFQKMSDAHLEKCIKCQGSVHRVVSGGAGIIFKGSGFYITDYGKGNNPPKNTKGTTPFKKSSTKSQTTAEKNMKADPGKT